MGWALRMLYAPAQALHKPLKVFLIQPYAPFYTVDIDRCGGDWCGIQVGNAPYSGVRFSVYSASFAFVSPDESFFWMLRFDTRAMGRVLDVVWVKHYKSKGSVTYPL